MYYGQAAETTASPASLSSLLMGRAPSWAGIWDFPVPHPMDYSSFPLGLIKVD